MLAEIENKLIQILREKLTDIPEENITTNTEINKTPAIIISNQKFKLKKPDMAENMDSGEVKLEEEFTPKATETAFKLKEQPAKNSVKVEFPLGTSLTEKNDYTIDYQKGSINLQKTPTKCKNNLKVTYTSKNRVLTLKTLKVKALYSIDTLGGSRVEADSLAEKVVKALLEVEDTLASEDIEIRPLGGMTFMQEKNAKTRLKYTIERMMRIEQVVGPMETIEIARKNR